jgi:hypothetical protein
MEQDAAGLSALMIVHSLMLALIEKRILDPEEIHDALEDVITSQRDLAANPAEAARYEAALRLTLQVAEDVGRAHRAAQPSQPPAVAGYSRREPH